MSSTGNMTPMDKSIFRWFRWIHRANMYSVGKVFRWKIHDVMTHGKQSSKPDKPVFYKYVYKNIARHKWYLNVYFHICLTRSLKNLYQKQINMNCENCYICIHSYKENCVCKRR